MIFFDFSNLQKALSWLFTRGGIAVWRSIDLSRPGLEIYAPADSKKPYWYVENTPQIVKDPAMVSLRKCTEWKRFHVAIRPGSNFLCYKLTDASSERVRKAVHAAGEGGSYEFDYFTQEAVIFKQSDCINLKDYIAAQAGTLYCIRAVSEEGIKDPETTVGQWYCLVQANVYIMDRDPQLSLIGDNGVEVVRPKINFIEARI